MSMTIDIDGNILVLEPLEKDAIRGLWAEAKWTFSFYRTSHMGVELIVAALKAGKMLTPSDLKHQKDRLEELFSAPVVFLLPPVPRYQRARYAERDLFYIIPDKGYARLPFLYAGRKIADREAARALTPASQYVLLWHLQRGNLEGLSVRELSEILPQSYLTLSRAVTVLEDVGLCRCRRDGKSKMLHFTRQGKELWEQAQRVLSSPVSFVWYCDALDGDGPVAGINALAHYTHLNPETRQTFALSSAQFKVMNPSRVNHTDGNYRIEIWKYPPLGGSGYVDRLSLALSLRGNNDERVQKEIELMLETIWSTE